MEKFIITKLPTRVALKVSAVSVVENQEYNLSEEVNFSTENTFGFPAEPLDTFKYKIKKDDVLSKNEGTVTVSFPVTLLDNPSLDVTKTLEINSTYVFTDEIPLTNNYDRIKILTISGKGLWILNGNTVKVGDIFYNYKIKDSLIFTANQSGSQEDYNTITFAFGHKNGFYINENTLRTDVTSVSEIEYDNITTVEEDRATIDFFNVTSGNFQVQNGPENATVQLRVNTTDYQNMGTYAEDELTIRTLDNEYVFNTQSASHYINTSLDENGYLNFSFEAKQKAPTATLGQFFVELVLINGSTANINPLKDSMGVILPIITL